MGQPLPLDPIGGDSWTGYSLYLVTYTTKEGTQAQTTIFASSTTEAVAIVTANPTIQQLFGPITNVIATPTTSNGSS